MNSIVNFEGNANMTMSSLEIAEITGKQHKHVLDDARKMLNSLGETSADFSANVPDVYGRSREVLNLDKEHTICLVSGYDVKVRMAIIRRWQELEASQTPKVPTTFREALLLAAEQQEQIEQQQLQLAQQKPAVDFQKTVADAEGWHDFSELGKIVGMGRNKLMSWLRGSKILLKNNTPYQEFIRNGMMKVVESPYPDDQGVTQISTKTVVSGKGMIYVEKRIREWKALLES